MSMYSNTAPSCNLHPFLDIANLSRIIVTQRRPVRIQPTVPLCLQARCHPPPSSSQRASRRATMRPRQGGGAHWANPAFLTDLAVALFQAASQAGALNPAGREDISRYLKARGHDVTWEAIRQHVIMVSRQTMKWDAKVHEDILIAICQHMKPSAGDWTKIMQEIHAMGYTFSESALRYASALHS
ncbi:hypothetical protein S40293_10696 [Stachybotrys chartarum IBT 40293]|nr:hypothetical protein S40293_10696 [Stachybotrys chartarum IBT 40293]